MLITDNLLLRFSESAFGNLDAMVTHPKCLHLSEVCPLIHLNSENIKKPIAYKI